MRECNFRVVLPFHFELDGPYPRGTELRAPRVKPVERQVEARRVNDVQIFLVRCVKGRKTHRSSYLLVSGEMSPRIAYFYNLCSYVGSSKDYALVGGLSACTYSQTVNRRELCKLLN